MRIVALSDTHGWHRSFVLPKGDVLIHAGDISHRGRKHEILDFMNWFEKQNFAHKIFIAGNHDFYFEKANPEEISQLIPANIIYLNDSGIELEGIRIWGSPITPYFFNWAFNRKRGDEIRKHWELIPPKTDLLLTHGPVFGFLDQLANEQHAGCQDLLRVVLTLKPRVHICGHIHESYGTIHRSGIKFINASVVNELYEPVNRPIVFDM